jgi:hypothetical protein
MLRWLFLIPTDFQTVRENDEDDNDNDDYSIFSIEQAFL